MSMIWQSFSEIRAPFNGEAATQKHNTKEVAKVKTPYTPQYPNLCKYLHVGKVTLRNRMCSAPMGFPDLTEDGCLTEGAIAFYENRAKGGAAIVTISEACVDYAHGKGHGRLINLQNPGVLAGLTNAARAIKRHGALACRRRSVGGQRILHNRRKILEFRA